MVIKEVILSLILGDHVVYEPIRFIQPHLF